MDVTQEIVEGKMKRKFYQKNADNEGDDKKIKLIQKEWNGSTFFKGKQLKRSRRF